MFVCTYCDFAFLDPAVDAGLDPEELFDDGYFTGGGAGYADYLAEAQLLRERGERYGRILKRAGVRNVLDVGAAAGITLLGLRDAGCVGVGIEPNASMVEHAVHRLGLDVQQSALEAFESEQQFDAVVMLQIVDHLANLERSFARLADLIRPGGVCLVEFGDRASVTARLFGRHWHEYAPPSVRRVFSLRALRLLFARCGFELQARGHPPKFLRVDHALSLLRFKARGATERGFLDWLGRRLPSGATLRYPGDDIAWALFVKSADAGIGNSSGTSAR